MKIEEVLKCYMSNSTLKSAIKFFNSIELTGMFRNICFLHDKPYNINIVCNEIGKNQE